MTTIATFLMRVISLVIHSLRPLVGGGLIVLGILGVILPILPGMPFLILGTLVIGRRSRIFRRSSVACKRFLQRRAAHERPWVARPGRWSLQAQRDSSRRLRHLLWWWQGRQRLLSQLLRKARPA